MDNHIEFFLMLLGAATFWWIMWKLITFVGDLIQYVVKSRTSTKEKK